MFVHCGFVRVLMSSCGNDMIVFMVVAENVHHGPPYRRSVGHSSYNGLWGGK